MSIQSEITARLEKREFEERTEEFQARRYRYTIRATSVLVLMHVSMAALFIAHRAVPVLPLPPNGTLEGLAGMADSLWWAAANLAVAAILTATIALDKPDATALTCSVSAAVTVFWSTLVLIWCQVTSPPSSLGTPVLTACFAVEALVLATVWSVLDPRKS